MSEILARVIRGSTVESIHRGHLIVVDGEGNVVKSVGNTDTVTFFRSSAKAFQAIPFLRSGAAGAFGFDEHCNPIISVVEVGIVNRSGGEFAE